MSHGVCHFPIEPIARFAKQSGTRQPVELTSFSFDAQRTLHHDDSSIAYYWPIYRPNVSLSTGFDKLISRDESINEHLDALLSSLVRYESTHGTGKTNVDIITWRGMITKFLALPYAQNDGFEMNVTRLKDTIYLEEHVSEAAKAEKHKREGDLRQRQMAYWGYKYEALATIPQIWDHTSRSELEGRDQNVVVNTNIQYCSVVRTRLGPVSMILGGEVDCVYDYKPTPHDANVSLDDDDALCGMKRPSPGSRRVDNIPDHYVELKTTKIQRSDRDRASFERFKLLKFWAQSFLLGIPRIIVGYRDDQGFLQQEEQLETLKIPGMVRASSASWDGNVCLNFAAEVLQFIRQTVLQKSEDGVWRIRYRPGAHSVEIFLLEESGHGQILTPEYLVHKSAQV